MSEIWVCLQKNVRVKKCKPKVLQDKNPWMKLLYIKMGLVFFKTLNKFLLYKFYIECKEEKLNFSWYSNIWSKGTELSSFISK